MVLQAVVVVVVEESPTEAWPEVDHLDNALEDAGFDRKRKIIRGQIEDELEAGRFAGGHAGPLRIGNFVGWSERGIERR